MGSYLVGRDEKSRILRRTVARYMLASLVLILRSVSVSVMKRYPTMEHIVDAGFPRFDACIIYCLFLFWRISTLTLNSYNIQLSTFLTK